MHTYDLTPNVTHLMVGEYETPKFRHVARERPDIQPMDAGWVAAVSELWKQDAEIDFAALEREWRLKPLEFCGAEVVGDRTEPRAAALVCLTGFDAGAFLSLVLDFWLPPLLLLLLLFSALRHWANQGYAATRRTAETL